MSSLRDISFLTSLTFELFSSLLRSNEPRQIRYTMVNDLAGDLNSVLAEALDKVASITHFDWYTYVAVVTVLMLVYCIFCEKRKSSTDYEPLETNYLLNDMDAKPKKGRFFGGMDEDVRNNRANQLNPDHSKSGPGHLSGYGGSGTLYDLDNHANQLNPNNHRFQSGL